MSCVFSAKEMVMLFTEMVQNLTGNTILAYGGRDSPLCRNQDIFIPFEVVEIQMYI